MDNETIENFVDTLCNFDIKELENETKFLEDYKKLKQENKELKKKIATYEDPEDLTLMYMYCDLKAKDKIEELKKQLEYEKKRASYWLNVTLSNAFLIRKNSLHQKMFVKYLEDEIYNIEPKETSINYNCEYDSEEDYINATEEQSRLNTLKEILQKYKKIIGDRNEKES